MMNSFTSVDQKGLEMLEEAFKRRVKRALIFLMLMSTRNNAQLGSITHYLRRLINFKTQWGRKSMPLPSRPPGWNVPEGEIGHFRVVREGGVKRRHILLSRASFILSEKELIEKFCYDPTVINGPKTFHIRKI
jgi:hypothetical protein